MVYARVCSSSVRFVLVAASVLMVSSLAFASPITNLSFVSEPAGSVNPGAYVEFKGGPDKTVTFTKAGDGYDFVISQSDSLAMMGIKGNITGTFSVGSIITVGSSLQTASLTGTGTFSLKDPSSQVLSATVVWNDIFTYGTGGGLNSAGTLNLSGWSYTGTFQPFLDIFGGQDRTVNIAFQFSPSKKLSTLMADGALNTTTYSGSFSMTPEPATLALLASGLTVAVVLRRRRR